MTRAICVVLASPVIAALWAICVCMWIVCTAMDAKNINGGPMFDRFPLPWRLA